MLMEQIIRIEDIQDEKNVSNRYFNHKKTYVLIDRIVVKEFDEDDIHRIQIL